MPRATVSERLRTTLKRLFKHGDAAALASFSKKRPGGQNILAQEISYFLNPEGKRRGLQLDDLDDIAAFLRISVGDLFEPRTPSELSGDEQRLVLAFRALSGSMREHVLALVETASAFIHREHERVGRNLLRHEITIGKNRRHPSAEAAIHGGSVVPAAPTVAEYQRYLSALTFELGAASAGEIPHRPTPSPHLEKTEGRGVVD